MDSESNTPDTLDERLDARRSFAQRLRHLRVMRGFRTARSLARALDIDENRYTRYERAEVEPDLSLLRRICAVLRATPSDLLGVPTGLADEQAPSPPERLPPRPQASPDRPAAPPSLEAVTWQLACLVAGLQLERAAEQAERGEVAPLSFLQAATGLYGDLTRRPFESIGQIVRDPAVAGADASAAQRLRDLVLALTEGLSRDAP